MKYFASILGLAIWGFLLLVLTVTIIGIVPLIIFEQFWDIPGKLLTVFES